MKIPKQISCEKLFIILYSLSFININKKETLSLDISKLTTRLHRHGGETDCISQTQKNESKIVGQKFKHSFNIRFFRFQLDWLIIPFTASKILSVGGANSWLAWLACTLTNISQISKFSPGFSLSLSLTDSNTQHAGWERSGISVRILLFERRLVHLQSMRLGNGVQQVK